MSKLATLAIGHDGDKVLLGMKKFGFGKGRWNGFGGRVEENETIEETAKRELLEEAGVSPLDLKKRGVINIHTESQGKIFKVHVFKFSKFGGQPGESEEMRPSWFHVSKIPFDNMWPNDTHWMPLFLDDKNFYGDFYLKDDYSIIRHTLKEVEILVEDAI